MLAPHSCDKYVDGEKETKVAQVIRTVGATLVASWRAPSQRASSIVQFLLSQTSERVEVIDQT